MKRNHIFLLDHHTFEDDTLVVVGDHRQDFVKFAKQHNTGEASYVVFTDIQNEFRSKTEGPKDCVIFDPATGITLMYLQKPDDTWEFFETLIHECSHLIDFILKDKRGMEKETEARAYHLAYVFRTIRRELMGSRTRKVVRRKKLLRRKARRSR